ncbi:restriction endonuclease [Streptomyces nojiriensis]|uniref:restriction endonuclease n=1 Tax=Streptomyces nojiriensis TaxID=66374 RepID=UPI0035D8998B
MRAGGRGEGPAPLPPHPAADGSQADLVGGVLLGGQHPVHGGGGALRSCSAYAVRSARPFSGLRYALGQLDGLHHRDFEFAVRYLMRRDGCRDARQVGGPGDNGADVIATDPYGRRWVIQCKHRKDGWSGKPVGTPDLQVLNGTGRQVHDGDVLVMLTNGRITTNATDFAKSQRLHLVDRHLLAERASGSRPLWELLRAPPPGGRRATP